MVAIGKEMFSVRNVRHHTLLLPLQTNILWLFKNNSAKKTTAEAPLHMYVFRQICYSIVTWRARQAGILEVLWTNLHLRSLDRLIVILPVVPAHSLSIDLPIKVQTIKV